MTAQELKNSILQLAVQGKLVTQNADDEPAPKLLKRIAQQKAAWIKAGKLKKEKGQPTLSEDDIPFDIPESWAWVRLGDFCSIYNGNSINAEEKAKKYSKKCEGYSFIATKDVGFDHSIAYDNGVYIPANLEDFKIAPAGSVLLCMEGGSAGRKIGVLEQDVCFGNKLCCLAPFVIFNKYLYYFLQSPAFFTSFTALMTGIIGGVGAAKIKSIAVPIPPLVEQERIVARIEELLPFVNEYDKAEKRLNAVNAEVSVKLRKSILQQAIQGKLTERNASDEFASELLKRIFEEKTKLIIEGKVKKEKTLSPIGEDEIPFDIPDKWQWVRFSELMHGISTGPFGSMLHKEDYVPEGIPVVNPANIINGEIIPLQSMMISEVTAQRLSSYRLTTGMIVMGRRGEMGRCAIVGEAENGWLCGTGSFFMTPSPCVCTPYLILFFASPYAKSYLGGASIGETMNNLNHNILKAIPVPLPPFAEQQRIVKRVGELLAVCDMLK